MTNLNEGKKKKDSYTAKLAEIEKAGQVATLEAKINALEEMIETKNQRLTMVSEDENLAELIDKKKQKEMQKEIKLLEKEKGKLEKLYEKMCGTKMKEVVDENPDEVESTDEVEEMDIPDEEDETLDNDPWDNIYPTNESKDFDIRKFMAEGKLLKEEMYGGYIEAMGPELTNAIDAIESIWYKWLDGPMTEPEDVEPAISDLRLYLMRRIDDLEADALS